MITAFPWRTPSFSTAVRAPRDTAARVLLMRPPELRPFASILPQDTPACFNALTRSGPAGAMGATERDTSALGKQPIPKADNRVGGSWGHVRLTLPIPPNQCVPLTRQLTISVSDPAEWLLGGNCRASRDMGGRDLAAWGGGAANLLRPEFSAPSEGVVQVLRGITEQSTCSGLRARNGSISALMMPNPVKSRPPSMSMSVGKVGVVASIGKL